MQTRARLGSKGLLPNGAVKAPICSLIGHLHLHLPGLPFALLHGGMAAQSFCGRVESSLWLCFSAEGCRFALPQACPRLLPGSPLPNPRFSAEAGSPSWPSFGRLAPTTLPVEPSPLRRSAAQDTLVLSVSQPAGRGVAVGGRWLAVLSDLRPAAWFLPNPTSPLPSFLWGIPGLPSAVRQSRQSRSPALGHPSHATCNQERAWPSGQTGVRGEATCASLFHASSWHTQGASMSHGQDPHPAILGRCGGREWCGRWAMIERPPLLPTSSSPPSSHCPKRPSRAWGIGIPRTKLPTSLSHLDLPRMYTCYFVTLNLISPLSPHSYDPLPLSPTTPVFHRTRLSFSPSLPPPCLDDNRQPPIRRHTV